ncbi:DNA-binding SARP family transcriptional activator [Kitasatospora sp. MAP12-15]|uniref:AfsR/SARP family transcriptional regulator n=1 Tax=unclassified Kitasatospora TaxID=2633591 RepID=UPI002474C6F0|nr:BTAD domain-containing putative transcriptional regulator [Kitasatospora sp. MAP12-44]MDH6113605.1 DNA-binding SARP family transcriptional activator [Kitasatospora sp. MAP12-44]
MVEEIRFSVLGALRIHRGETVLVSRSPQLQALLVALLLRPGRSASAHELITAIWGDSSPDSALASLRTYAWRLRQTLEVDRTDPRLLISLHDGYQLVIPPDSVDANYAEKLAADAARARSQGRDDDCSRLLGEALGLWQGEPLSGVPGPYADQQRSRLNELRRGLLEERFDHNLRLGRNSAVIPELTAFIAEHPLQERPYGFLMRALYSSGRQADALAVFTRARHVLAEELGVDPGPELSALHARILAGDPLLSAAPQEQAQRIQQGPEPVSAPQEAHPDEQSAPVGAVGADAEEPPGSGGRPHPVSRPAQLPADTADFTGRAAEVVDLCRVLTSTTRTSLPVVSVAGMGGIGKTTLALRVAHLAKPQFTDGQLYADLGGNGLEPAEPRTVLGSLLTTLGVPGHALPNATEDRARLFRSLLDGRRILLLLDNARDPAQVRPLLPGSADCAVIVTSRARLAGLPTSAQADLAVFTTDEAIALLRSIVGGERATDEQAATELVTACGHLPLAVRIVAARLAARPQWQVETMTRRLADQRRRIGELRAGDLAVAAAFELGYRQLTDGQARAFRLLAPTARTGVGLAAAAAALDLAEEDAEDLLEALVDAAMLEAPLPGRYRFHDLVRSFALQLPAPPPSEDDDERGAALARMLDHLLAGGSAAFRRMVPGDPVGVFLVRSPAAGPQLGSLSEARAWVATEFDCITNAVTLATQSPPGPEGRLLRTATDLLVSLSPYGKGIPYGQLAEAARTVAETAALRGDDRAEGRARFVCGNAALQNTQLAEAELHIRLATEACLRADDRVILQQTLNDQGLIAQLQQNYSDAVRYYDQGTLLARELGHHSGELTTVLNAAQARLRSGRTQEALLACDEALAALRAVADQHGIAYAHYVRGLALHELERYDDAAASYLSCLALCEAEGIRGQEAQARLRLADTLRRTGKSVEALSQAQQALARCEELGAERDRGHALVVLSHVLAELGELQSALARAVQARAVFTGLGLPDAVQAGNLVADLELALEPASD